MVPSLWEWNRSISKSENTSDFNAQLYCRPGQVKSWWGGNSPFTWVYADQRPAQVSHRYCGACLETTVICGRLDNTAEDSLRHTYDPWPLLGPLRDEPLSFLSLLVFERLFAMINSIYLEMLMVTSCHTPDNMLKQDMHFEILLLGNFSLWRPRFLQVVFTEMAHHQLRISAHYLIKEAEFEQKWGNWTHRLMHLLAIGWQISAILSLWPNMESRSAHSGVKASNLTNACCTLANIYEISSLPYMTYFRAF